MLDLSFQNDKPTYSNCILTKKKQTIGRGDQVLLH
jgi:hypothetical protein